MSNCNYFYEISQIFDLISINMSTMYWEVFQTIILYLFLFLVGISITRYSDVTFKSHILKGFKIFFFGLLITILSFIFIRENFVFFGVLHIIGLEIILSYFFRKYIYLNIVFSFIFVLLGSFLNTNLTIILFLVFNPNLLSIDYVPLLPWFGVILLGICIGNLFKKYFNKRTFVINLNNSSKFIKKNFLFLEYLGKNSFIIYLIHQPIILFGLL